MGPCTRKLYANAIHADMQPSHLATTCTSCQMLGSNWRCCATSKRSSKTLFNARPRLKAAHAGDLLSRSKQTKSTSTVAIYSKADCTFAYTRYMRKSLRRWKTYNNLHCLSLLLDWYAKCAATSIVILKPHLAQLNCLSSTPYLCHSNNSRFISDRFATCRESTYY